MKVAIYQQPGSPLSIVSFGESVDPVKESKRVTPSGVPFWVVDSSYVDDNFADTEDTPRASWSISTSMLATNPSGVGEKTD